MARPVRPPPAAHCSLLRSLQPGRTEPVTLELPAAFLALCEADKVSPETVLRGFIADVCEIRNDGSEPRQDGYQSNGSDERRLARAYYDRVGYPYMHD